mmetsp:Transcript_6193/g.7628  ORF Transcript_6193/g.7628 Transcript_6193/m.7628 type:complete len:276 (-) Transcript_6193:56-883(-)
MSILIGSLLFRFGPASCDCFLITCDVIKRLLSFVSIIIPYTTYMSMIDFVPMPSSFLFSSKSQTVNNTTEKKPLKSSLQLIYLNAKEGLPRSQRTLKHGSLVMQVGFVGKSCFNFHEISLRCELIEVVGGHDLAGIPISCHAQPNSSGDQVTLEYPVKGNLCLFKILVTAIHTQSGKNLTSLTLETPEIFVPGSSLLRKRSRKELNVPTRQTKAQKLTESQDQALSLFSSSDLLSLEEIFDLDVFSVDFLTSPMDQVNHMVSMEEFDSILSSDLE